eukprot:tig00000180_g13640.t1
MLPAAAAAPALRLRGPDAASAAPPPQPQPQYYDQQGYDYYGQQQQGYADAYYQQPQQTPPPPPQQHRAMPVNISSFAAPPPAARALSPPPAGGFRQTWEGGPPPPPGPDPYGGAYGPGPTPQPPPYHLRPPGPPPPPPPYGTTLPRLGGPPPSMTRSPHPAPAPPPAYQQPSPAPAYQQRQAPPPPPPAYQQPSPPAPPPQPRYQPPPPPPAQPQRLPQWKPPPPPAAEAPGRLVGAGETVALTILSGHGLVPRDLNGKSDPFVQVTYNGREVGTSPAVSNSLDPVWNYRVEFQVARGGHDPSDVVLVKVFDKDLIGKDYLGEAALPLSEARAGPGAPPALEAVHPLSTSDTGEVSMQELQRRQSHIRVRWEMRSAPPGAPAMRSAPQPPQPPQPAAQQQPPPPPNDGRAYHWDAAVGKWYYFDPDTATSRYVESDAGYGQQQQQQQQAQGYGDSYGQQQGYESYGRQQQQQQPGYESYAQQQQQQGYGQSQSPDYSNRGPAPYIDPSVIPDRGYVYYPPYEGVFEELRKWLKEQAARGSHSAGPQGAHRTSTGTAVPQFFRSR